MRLQPLPPQSLAAELRGVHEEIVSLITQTQGQAAMIDTEGALLGPFPAMLHFPQFGVPALTFLRSLDNYATLPKAVREVAILSVAGPLGARFMLYVHEIMAEAFGLSPLMIASLAAGGRPQGLNAAESIACDIAHALISGRIISAATYQAAVRLLGTTGVAELYFLIGGYSLIAAILNGFDVPAADC